MMSPSIIKSINHPKNYKTAKFNKSKNKIKAKSKPVRAYNGASVNL